jgi:hypothetical protein
MMNHNKLLTDGRNDQWDLDFFSTFVSTSISENGESSSKIFFCFFGLPAEEHKLVCGPCIS